MIPISLSIKGLYSYTEKQEIQFDNLTSAGLFGIFGPVGSGKSTILEAITFALYNNTERLNSRDLRSYNMMNLQSDELSVEFECEVGNPAERYRFSVSAKRNKKDFKKVGSMERRVAKRMSDGQWMPLKDEKSTTAEDIIGLSYDNFKRAIIIPQGRFQDFIDLGGAERTQMMKEIFKLEKYDLSSKVSVLTQQNNEKKASLEGNLQQLGTATLEELESFKQQLQLTIEQSTRASQQVNQLTQTAIAYKELKEIEELLSRRLVIWQALEEQRPQKMRLEQKIKLYEKANQSFRPLFIQKQERANELQLLEASISQLQQNIEAHEQNLANNKQQREELAPQLEALPNHKNEVVSLQKIAVVQEVRQELNRQLQHQQNILLDKTRIENELAALQAQRTNLQDTLSRLATQIPENFERTVSDVRVWFTQLRNLEANKRTIKQEATNILNLENNQKQAITQIGTELSSIFTSDTPSQISTIDEIRDVLVTSLMQIERNITELEAQLNNEKVKEKLQHFAHELQDGEPCPLCGSVHHPSKIEAGHETVPTLEKILDKEKRKSQKLQELNQRFLLAEGTWRHIEEQKQAIREKWDTALRLHEEHTKSFTWEHIPTLENDFDVWKASNTQLVTQQKQATESIQNLQVAMEQKTAEIQQINETRLRDNQQRVVAAQTQIQVLEQQMNMETLVSYAEMSVSELSVVIQQKEDNIKRIEEKAQQLEETFQLLKQQLETQKGIFEERTREITNKQQAIHSIQAQINDLLCNTPEFQEEYEVHQMLEGWTLEQLRLAQQDVQAYFAQLHSVKADLEEIRAKKQNNFGDLTFDAQRAVQLDEELNKVKAEHAQLLENKGRLEVSVQSLTEQLEKKVALLEQLQRVTERSIDLRTLETLFRSSGFVNYISKIYLENLCQMANERFSRMTKQQLELTLGEDNTFWVRDMLNGGHLRLLKTLSGGQKFQAALSLALALADSIHSQQKMANNFFFIDEGFGSLDKNSLQIVFETLKSLRRENRIVGVISHVEELKQEIQAYLSISKMEDEGSRISRSWEVA